MQTFCLFFFFYFSFRPFFSGVTQVTSSFSITYNQFRCQNTVDNCREKWEWKKKNRSRDFQRFWVCLHDKQFQNFHSLSEGAKKKKKKTPKKEREKQTNSKSCSIPVSFSLAILLLLFAYFQMGFQFSPFFRVEGKSKSIDFNRTKWK